MIRIAIISVVDVKRTCLQWKIIKIISLADQKMLNETVTLYIICVLYIVLYNTNVID